MKELPSYMMRQVADIKIGDNVLLPKDMTPHRVCDRRLDTRDFERPHFFVQLNKVNEPRASSVWYHMAGADYLTITNIESLEQDVVHEHGKCSRRGASSMPWYKKAWIKNKPKK